jgi:hypothetical protein
MSVTRRKRVPRRIATCPECGGALIVEYDAEEEYFSGLWVTEWTSEINTYCETKAHGWKDRESDPKWEPVLDSVYAWMPHEER